MQGQSQIRTDDIRFFVSRIHVEVSADSFAISLPMRLVSVAALLRRYSPSPHPLLRLLSHVPTLAYNNQSSRRTKLTTLRDYIQGDQVCSQGT